LTATIIAEDFVGFLNTFKHFNISTLIGVVLTSEITIRLLDLVRCCRSFQTEALIEV
jgi:hypothetical protein